MTMAKEQTEGRWRGDGGETKGERDAAAVKIQLGAGAKKSMKEVHTAASKSMHSTHGK